MSTGLVSEVSTSDGAADFYTYDAALANLATHPPPLGAATVIARDAIGRDTLAVTPVAAGDTLHVRTRYDRMGRDTLTVRWGRRDSLTVRQRYDAEGELVAVTQYASPDTNHLGDVTRSFAYDAVGRKQTESLAGTVIARWTYNPAENLLTGGPCQCSCDCPYIDRVKLPTLGSHSAGSAHATGRRADHVRLRPAHRTARARHGSPRTMPRSPIWPHTPRPWVPPP